MKCQFCRKEPECVTLVHHPRVPGQMYSCISCAIERGLYCKKHGSPNSRHASGGTVCMRCIAEDRQTFAGQAKIFHRKLLQSLSEKELARVREWMDDMGNMWGGPEMTVLHALAMEARRRRISIEEVIAGVRASHSADAILPQAY